MARFNVRSTTQGLDLCEVDTVHTYQKELVEGAGLAFGPFVPRVAAVLCSKLTEGAGATEPPYSGNLIVATNASLGNLVQAGFAQSAKGSVLLLPRDKEVLEAARDALYIEAWRLQVTSTVDPWVTLAEKLVGELEYRSGVNWLALGARSPLCHQGHVIAYAQGLDEEGERDPETPDLWDFRTGRRVDAERHESCKGGLVMIRVQLPEKKWAKAPYPAWVSAGVCRSCGIAVVSLRLGLARVRSQPLPHGWSTRHKHTWTPFRLPAADLSPTGHFGFVKGRVCLEKVRVRSRSETSSDICGEVSNVSILPVKTPSFGRPGLNPELRLPIGRSHVHTWAKYEIEDRTGFEIRCVTCDAVVARTATQAASEGRRVAANPSLADFERQLPWLGEGDMTGDLLLARDRRTS